MELASISTHLPRTREESQQVQQLVSFRIGSEEFGVDILMVQEIIRLTTITPIPNASRSILGMINLRGRIIPVVDLRWLLRIQGGESGEGRKKARILIIELGGYVTGFVVDSVSEVMKVPVAEIEPAPSLVASSISSAYISGVIKRPQRLIILLDFKHILKPQETKELESIGMQAALTEYGNSYDDTDIHPDFQNKDPRKIKE
jgi:purine-binding chemotaxis protein CheW